MDKKLNKSIFSILCCIAIGLGSFATTLSLLANIEFLSYLLLSLTFFSGFLLVRVNNRN